RLRRVLGPPRRTPGAVLSRPRAGSARSIDHDHRGHRERRHAAPAAARVSRGRRAAVRRLHARLHHRREGAPRREPEPDRSAGALLARRQSVPVHRLRQDHPRGPRHRGDDERGSGGMSERTFEVVGTRPVRHDGVDKVTGRAAYGADANWPGMLHGALLRSPHAHARIVSIDTRAAAAAPGVKAVLIGADLPDTHATISLGEAAMDVRDMSHNLMARDKVVYHGQAVAAVAATTLDAAREALGRIVVQYEVLTPVLTVDEALAPGAPLLHDDLVTKGAAVGPKTGTNLAGRYEFKRGDVDAGFQEADTIVEREFRTATVHQGYIEPHACIARCGEDGRAVVWCSTQGPFVVRDATAAIAGLDAAHVKVIPSEIGGGFGGKIVVYLEPIAVALSRKAQRPVKMVMSRDEVFRAT